MNHLDLNTITLPVIIREPVSLKSIIRKFMVVDNYADNSYWFKKQLVKDSGKFNLTSRFKN